MDDLVEKLIICIERGKADANTSYPPDLKGQDGASELTQKLIDASMSANDILSKALVVGMHNIGEKFSKGQAFIPDLLISARAMDAAMEHLKPYFESGDVQHKGIVVLGTIAGDLHDIGKNIVGIVLKGNGWNVIDLGIDVSTDKFVNAVEENPGCLVGMSALLTTTMMNMEQTTKAIKEKFPQTQVFIGGAPVSTEFNQQIGADGYFPDPHSFVNHIRQGR